MVVCRRARRSRLRLAPTLILIVIAIWCARSGASPGRHHETIAPFDPPTADALAALDQVLAPMRAEDFLAEFYRRKVLFRPRGSGTAFGEASMTAALVRMDDPDFAMYKDSPRAVRLLNRTSADVDASSLYGVSWQRFVADWLPQGYSVVFRQEDLTDKSLDPFGIQALVEHAVHSVFATTTTTHYYLTGPGAQALPAHTDVYDVLVLHLAGRKKWTTCIPRVGHALLSDAERAQLADTLRSEGRWGVGCAATSESFL